MPLAGERAPVSSHYRELVRHSGVYAAGVVLQRVASLVLLPVYTRYLPPQQYGAIALLDATVAVMDILISKGVVTAMSRMHSAAQNERERDSVWWTAACMLAGGATVVTLGAVAARASLAEWILGGDIASGSTAVALIVGTLWFNSVGSLFDTYVRIRKWSTLYVGLSVTRLVLNAILNVCLLVLLNRGMFAVLTGNLCTAAVMATIGLVVFGRSRGAPVVGWQHVRAIVAYGSPLIVTTLLAYVMHQADRFLLRPYVPLSVIGIYVLAYQIGQGINTLVLGPFSSIWGIAKFEIEASDDAHEVFGRVADVFATGLLAILLTVSLFAEPLVVLLAGRAYEGAASLIPPICLGYFFFSLSTFFNLPAELKSRTARLIPGSAIAAGTNVLANLLLIPRYGIHAAAWTTALTFAVLAVTSYLFCRDDRPTVVPFIRLSTKLAVAAVVVSLCRGVAASTGVAAPYWLWVSVVWMVTILGFAASVWPDIALTSIQRGGAILTGSGVGRKAP